MIENAPCSYGNAGRINKTTKLNLVTSPLHRGFFIMDIPLLPQPLIEYSDTYAAYDIMSEAEEWNRGVWDAVTAVHPNIVAIEQESPDYQAGFVSGLNYRFQSKYRKQPRRQGVDVV